MNGDGIKKYYGEYSLFNEVQEIYFKHHNRGVVMANIIEDNSSNYQISVTGLNMVREYLSLIPEEDREFAYNAMVETLIERGWKIDEM